MAIPSLKMISIAVLLIASSPNVLSIEIPGTVRVTDDRVEGNQFKFSALHCVVSCPSSDWAWYESGGKRTKSQIIFCVSKGGEILTLAFAVKSPPPEKFEDLAKGVCEGAVETASTGGWKEISRKIEEVDLAPHGKIWRSAQEFSKPDGSLHWIFNHVIPAAPGFVIISGSSKNRNETDGHKSIVASLKIEK